MNIYDLHKFNNINNNFANFNLRFKTRQKLIMTLQEAISILKIHQQWRLGADIVMIEPKELTKAIDVLINYHIDIMNETLSSQTEISDEEIKKWAKEYTCKEYDRLIFDYENYDTYDDFINGAKKYREKLKLK